MKIDQEKIAHEIMLAQISAGVQSDLISSSIKLASQFAEAISAQRKEKPIRVVSKDKEEKVKRFLSWFNTRKTAYSGKESRIKTLTDADVKNYIKISASCNKEDFEIAISNLFKSNWANENNMITPSHFLRVEVFNRYLGQGVDNGNKFQQLL